MKHINTKLDKTTHTYFFDEGITPLRIVSGSNFYPKKLVNDYTKSIMLPFSKVALPLGTGIHEALENLVNWYFSNKDSLNLIPKIVKKYEVINPMLSNLIANLFTLINEFSHLETEQTKAMLNSNNIAFCGTADLIIDNKILVDYKTIFSKDSQDINYVFEVALNDVLSQNEANFWVDENLYYSLIGYVWQFGLYSVLFECEQLIMLTADKNGICRISKENTEKLKNIVIDKINKTV